MKELVRKIARSKWDHAIAEQFEIKNLSADVITSDLRTTNNNLSTWIIENENELDDAVLALAASQTSKIDKMAVIWFEWDEGLPFSVKQTKVPSNVRGFGDEKHADICDLNYSRIPHVAGTIIEAIRNERFKLYTRGQVLEILKKGIGDNRVNIDGLAEDVKKDLKNKRII